MVRHASPDPEPPTGLDLIAFIDGEVRVGRLQPDTASSRKSGVRGVLQASFGDAWEYAPVSLDQVTELVEKFVADATGEKGHGTISSYSSHYRRAVETYFEVRGAGQAADGRSASEALITHRFPLRRDLVVTFALPADLSAGEAQRLASLIQSLPIGA
jgi:hypothetical protein